jgi:membrane associated rhomboid family serine protease
MTPSFLQAQQGSNTPRRISMAPERERIFNIPGVVLALVVILLAIHGLRALLTPEHDLQLLQRFAFVPGRFTFAFDPDMVSHAYNEVARKEEMKAEIARYFLGDGDVQWWTPLTYAFLHGNWAHVGFNCLWLVAFGAAVARRFMAMRFLVFFVVTAIAGALMHFLTHMADLEPVIGASAVVSGTMAAATRFAFQPGAPLGETLGLGHRHGDAGTYRLPAPPLREVFKDRRVVSFLAVWFLVNFVFGYFSLQLGAADATVAWEAHIGGFLAGFFLFPWFDPKIEQQVPQTEEM